MTLYEHLLSANEERSAQNHGERSLEGDTNVANPFSIHDTEE